MRLNFWRNQNFNAPILKQVGEIPLQTEGVITENVNISVIYEPIWMKFFLDKWDQKAILQFQLIWNRAIFASVIGHRRNLTFSVTVT